MRKAIGCCETCGSPSLCIHDFPKEKYNIQTFNLGESLGSANSTSIIEPQKILNAISDNQFKLNPNSSKTMTNNSATELKSRVCSVCFQRIAESYLNDHLIFHIKESDDWINKFVSAANDTNPTSTSMVRVGNIETEEKVKVTEEDVNKFLHRTPPTRINPRDEFSFRKVKNVSWLSSTSSDGRYSDVLVSVWFQPTVSSVNGHHFGGVSSNNYLSYERLNIHILYDSEDEYFIFQGKILKRSNYSTYDNEESAIQERICFQDQLCSELRKMLIFFNVPPRTVYKKFRKMMNKPILMETDESGIVVFALSNNHQELLDSTKSAPKTYDDDDNPYKYGC